MSTDEKARQLYADMGAVPVINALGHRTMLGGSTPSPGVQEAMRLAGRYYVDMDELLQSTGRLVAGLLSCQAALITPGCAAALLLGTAACMSGKDPEKMGRLPDAEGMKREVIVQKAQRYKYDRVVRMAGARIVEAGRLQGTTAQELEEAIGPHTAAVLYPAIDNPASILPLQTVLDIAHGRAVPVVVDAAYRVYPLAGLKEYTALGADLVGYGAKYFGAPNSSGLLCGRADLVEAARLHSFASFEKNALPGFGRPLKIDRQEVVAVVVALREWLSMDHAKRIETAARRASALRRALGSLPHVALSTGEGPNLSLSLDEAALGLKAAALEERLRRGNPSVWLHVEGPALHLSMFTMEDGDVELLAARLREEVRA